MNDQEEINLELETTVPTDLTVSSFSDEGKKKENQKHDAFKDRKHILREVQLLKLELTRKDAIINNLKRELTEKTTSFDEKLKDALHQKQVAETRLKAQLTFSEEEFNYKFNLAKKEFHIIQQAKKALEDEVQSLKNSLNSSSFNEDDFKRLRSLPKETLTLTHYILLKFYERESSLKRENDFLKSRSVKVEKLLPSLEDNLQTCREDLQREKSDNTHLKERYNKLLTEYNDIASRIQHGNYAQENFSRIKCERDRLSSEILDVKQNFDGLKIELLEVIRDKDVAKEEITKLKQDQAVLQKECDTVSRQLNDVTQRWGESQDKNVQLQSELDRSKSSYTELMERFMRARDQQRIEYEDRLQFEKNRIDHAATNAYEKEIRSLTESKNSFLRQKETAEVTLIELKKKYEKLFSEYQENSGKELNHMKKLQRELAKTEENLHRADTALNHLQTRHQEKCKEYDAVTLKLQLVVEELDALKKSSYEKSIELETELGACKARLEIFEKLENEINEVINEAAQIADSNAEEKLDELAHQLSIPTSSRFSFVCSVKLTRKVMELERKLVSLQIELNNELETNKKLLEELEGCHSSLKQIEQPYSYLISTIRENEERIHELSTKVKSQKEQLELILKEKSQMEIERNQLLEDLELILKNREEMNRIKQQLESFKVTEVTAPSDINRQQQKQENNTVPKRLAVSKQVKR